MSAFGSVLTSAQRLPGAAVDLTFRGARVPYEFAARVSGRGGAEDSPPVLAFESFEATVETTVGSWCGDQSLVQRGQLRRAKVDQLRSALDLETAAEQQRAEAEQDRIAREQELEQARADAAEQAERQEKAVQDRAAERELAVEQAAAEKAARAQAEQDTRDKALARKERAEKAASLAEEAQALRESERALDAQATVSDLGDAIEAKKAARKSD